MFQVSGMVKEGTHAWFRASLTRDLAGTPLCQSNLGSNSLVHFSFTDTCLCVFEPLWRILISLRSLDGWLGLEDSLSLSLSPVSSRSTLAKRGTHTVEKCIPILCTMILAITDRDLEVGSVCVMCACACVFRFQISEISCWVNTRGSEGGRERERAGWSEETCTPYKCNT